MPTSDDHARSRCAVKRLACDASRRKDVVASNTVRPLTALSDSGTTKLIANSLTFHMGAFESGALNMRLPGGRARQSRCQPRPPDTGDDGQPPPSMESVERIVSG